MAVRIIIAVLICFCLTGCLDGPPKIETQIIKVPVEVQRKCPDPLCAPIQYGPAPIFLTDPAHPTWVYLDEEGQRRLRDTVTLDHGRLRALMDWATAAP